MMKDPMGWAGANGSIPSEIEALFENAQRARGMTQAQRLRMNHAVQSIAATPVAPWPMVIAKNFIVASIGVMATGALLNGESGTRFAWPNTLDKPAAIEIPHVVEHRRAEQEKPQAPHSDIPFVSKENDTVAPAVAFVHPSPTKHRKPAAKPTTSPIAAVPDAPREEKPPIVSNDEDTLDREIESLEKARGALETNPGATLDQLEEYKKNFSAGRLSLAREVLAIDALLRLGRKAEARTRAEALLTKATGTPYEARVLKQWNDAK